VGSLLRQYRGRESQLQKFLLEAKAKRQSSAHPAPKGPAQTPVAKLKIVISQQGVMGIRLEQDSAGGCPQVRAVTPRCEAAQQGLMAGYVLQAVQGVSAQVTEYSMLLSLIASLHRPIVLKFQWPGVDGDAERPTNKKHKEDRKEEKVKKKKKKKKKKADNTETRKRKRCSSRDSATDGSQ